MSFGMRLKEIRRALNLNQGQFAERVDVTQGNLSRYEQDKQEPSLPTVTKIICEFDINPQWLLTGEGEMLTSSTDDTSIQTEKKEIAVTGRDDVVMVPVLDQRISAGPGQEYIEEYSSGVTIPILEKIIHPYPKKSIRVVEVRGDSMTGVKIFDGDYVIFSQGELRADGIYVISIGADLFVKRLEFDPIENRLTIHSENPSYEKKVVDADSDVVRVEGKVIGWIHKHPY